MQANQEAGLDDDGSNLILVDENKAKAVNNSKNTTTTNSKDQINQPKEPQIANKTAENTPDSPE